MFFDICIFLGLPLILVPTGFQSSILGTKVVPVSRAGVHEFRVPGHRGDCLSGAPHISGASVWNLFHVTALAPRILRWLQNLWNFVYLCFRSKLFFLTVD
jgi:hypothetical protein